ncbi:hypothetical protein C0991_002302 [Blastosporella zonata]|nr:hypothetical protein C0991_002302 [Blastosporella zonata]
METWSEDLLDFCIAPQVLSLDNTALQDDAASLDTENLKLLAQFCSSFINDSFVDSEENAPSSGSPITIATPVPLPYSARSRDVLKRMISAPKENFIHSSTLAEELERVELNLDQVKVSSAFGYRAMSEDMCGY